MNREEAVKWLSDVANDYFTSDAEADALNMAIKALEQPEPCEDIEDALRILDAIRSSGKIEYNDYCDLHDAISLIRPEPCEDAISRQAAITIPIPPKWNRKYLTTNLDDAYELGWDDCQKCVEALPAAQPEQLQDNCEGCYYKDRIGYQLLCESCARYFSDRYSQER